MTSLFSQRALASRKLEHWIQVYRDQPELFRLFEKAEDPEGLSANRLAALAAMGGKRVLEIGCGTGWLTRHIAALAGSYHAVEPSASLLNEAGDLHPAQVLQATGQHLPFADGFFDRIVMSWVLLDLRPSVRRSVLRECERVLKPQVPTHPDPNAGIWLIENGAGGEFQSLRDLVDTQGHGEVTPLIEQHGFVPVESVSTHLCFQSEQEAALVLGAILGSRAALTLDREPRALLGMDLSILFRPAATS